MEVSSSNNTYNINHQRNKNISVSSENKSFENEIIDKSNSKEESKGIVLTFLEKTNAFEHLTKDETIKFKHILEDDKVTQREFDSIPFEMLEKFRPLVLPTNTEHFNEFPYVHMDNKSKHLLSTIDLSSNSEFNESVFKTYSNMSENHIVNMSLELATNLSQAFHDDDLEIFYINGLNSEIKNISPNIMKQLDLDFEKVLTEIINMSDEYINKAKDPQVLNQLYSTKNFYSSILGNFNDFK